MASKIMTTSHTKHVNIWCKYVNEYVEDEIVKIIFIKLADKVSNILTKNLNAELQEKHARKMVIRKP